jgi:predicted amidohydrolase
VETSRAAVIQVRSTGELERNLERVRKQVRAACQDGAEWVVLPENFAWLRVPGAQPPPVGPADPKVDGCLVAQMASLAREEGCHLLLGGLPEQAEGSDKFYNAFVWLDPKGEVLAHYRKRHLFDVELPDGTVIRESDYNLAGDGVVCAQTPFGAVGLSICYDLRFPEHYRALSDQGAEIMTAPAAFTKPTGQAHWHLLVRTRAVESQCFMLAPNQAGHHGGDRYSYGHSLIVDPWGEVLAEVKGEEEGFACADLDPQRLTDIRAKLPALEHRL